ncbi:hypothetical protein SSCG_02870 [Streptomyces clavuligerus]|nr:hypothetical protein SSCG_02870 [Streptomyces clavuligerus]
MRPGTIRRTTSGKIQRTLMRRLFASGAVVPLHAVLDPAVRALVAAAETAAGAAAGAGTAGAKSDPTAAPAGTAPALTPVG